MCSTVTITATSATTSGQIVQKMRSQDSLIVQQTNNNFNFNSGEEQNSTLNSSTGSNQSGNWSKIQALKQRKCELEKLLNEKNLLLQQIQKQEAQLIGEHNNLEQSFNLADNGNSTILRRKVGTSYKLPKNLLNCKEDNDIEKLLLDKKIQQEICNAAFKLANDPNISKSIRRTHKAEYEAAQQKLIAIHYNLSILKKRQTQAKSPNNSTTTTISTATGPGVEGSSTIPAISNVNLTKSPSIQHSNPDISTKQCNNIVDNFNNYNNNNKHVSNTVNSYYSTERRNSMKSATLLNSPKHFDDNGTLLVDRSLKNYRSNYDVNRLVTNENNRVSMNHCLPAAYNNYFCNNYTVQQQQQKIDDVENYNNNHHQQELTDGGGYFGYNNNNVKYVKLPNDKYTNFTQNFQQYDDGGFVKLPINGQNIRQSYNLPGISDQQYIVGVLSEKNFYNSGSRKYDTVDSVSISPSTVTSLNDHHIGLGGYWKTLPNNERVWCAVENCYDSNGTQQQHNKAKKINASMPIKASSLGNFDLITTKDESVDQISISSMNSETSKKTKEKQWLETSLDGPLIRSKSASSSNEVGSRSLSHGAYNSAIVTTHQHTLSPTFSTYNHTHTHHHAHKYHKYGNRSKLSSQSMSGNSYRPTVTKLEDQTYLSQSTSVLNNGNNSNNTNENQFNQCSLIAIVPSPDQQNPSSSSNNQILSISPGHLSPNSLLNSSKYSTLKTARSPIIANINKASDIRIESPKNMTVIQQATFMPYKEVTKPFEMSDFYKYSTKFRQKEAKQQQCVSSSITPVVADAN